MIRIEKHVFKYALLWLLVLAPFFYISYGFSNFIAQNSFDVPEIYFQWEKLIPFWAWTIIPYWCLNIFYGLSLFIQKSKSSVNRLVARYLVAQLLAVACFILFPLQISFLKPETQGLFGQLFGQLAKFDQPYNQAPSLHIALLTIVWDVWRTRLKGIWLYVWHIFCALVALSVLTTYQHHFIDVPTGFLLGLFCLWLFPEEGALPFKNIKWSSHLRHKNIALIYFFIALICLNIAYFAFCNGIGLIALWPMLCFAILGFGYLGAGVKIFQKSQDGTVSFASTFIFAPYRWAAWVNSRIWTRQMAHYHEIVPNIYLGRFPSLRESKHFGSIIDMTGEFKKPVAAKNWHSFPMLDLVAPDFNVLHKALGAIGDKPQKPVLICCALGLQRSAIILGHYLCQQKYASDLKNAEVLIQEKRPVIFPHDDDNCGFSFKAAALYCFLNIILTFLSAAPFYDYWVHYSNITYVLGDHILYTVLIVVGYFLWLCLHLLFDSWLFFKQRRAVSIKDGLYHIDRLLLQNALRKAPPSYDISVRMNNIYRIVKSLWTCVLIVIIVISGALFYLTLMNVIIWLL